MPRPPLPPLDEVTSLLQRVLAGSPADWTEISWIELRQGLAGRESRDGPRQGRDGAASGERTVVVRVWERGRAGSHRTGVGSLSELSAAVREALGQARLAPPPGYPRPSAASASSASSASGASGAQAALPEDVLFDPALAELEPAASRELLAGWTERGETARLAWVEGQVVVAASDRRPAAVRATAVALDIARGRGPAAGRAAGAARTLAGLDAPAIVERARRREAAGASHETRDAAPSDLPGAPVPLLLAPEAAAALIDLLNRSVFSSAAFRDGASPLRGQLETALFDPAITLVDDAADRRGLPFPFDLAGAPKRPLELIGAGIAHTPALDYALAAELGRPATPHFLSPDESRATNLFLRPGSRSEADLRREVGAAGGLWVGWLGPLEVYDPAGLGFRARLGGVRGLGASGGTELLSEALPDLLWEDRLPDALSRLMGVGDEPVVVGAADPLLLLLGGISAPALALDLRGRGAILRTVPTKG